MQMNSFSGNVQVDRDISPPHNQQVVSRVRQKKRSKSKDFLRSKKSLHLSNIFQSHEDDINDKGDPINKGQTDLKFKHNKNLVVKSNLTNVETPLSITNSSEVQDICSTNKKWERKSGRHSYAKRTLKVSKNIDKAFLNSSDQASKLEACVSDPLHKPDHSLIISSSKQEIDPADPTRQVQKNRPTQSRKRKREDPDKCIKNKIKASGHNDVNDNLENSQNIFEIAVKEGNMKDLKSRNPIDDITEVSIVSQSKGEKQSTPNNHNLLVNSPPSLRKRELLPNTKVHFCDGEPDIFEYSPSEIDPELCFLCREDASDGNASTIKCDSCLRQFHRECISLRHGTDLTQRDRRIPFICLICLTGSTRASRRSSIVFDPKIYKSILRSILDMAVVPVRQRKKNIGLMDDGLDTEFWPYLEPIESNLNSFQTLQELKDALRQVYEKIQVDYGSDSAQGKEARRLVLWFENVFTMLGAPLHVRLRDA